MTQFGKRFGRLVARKREQLGLSLAQVALLAYGDDGQGGDSRKRDVMRLEQGGSKKPNAATIRKYRLALGLSEEEIDACRTPGEIKLAHFADRLFKLITEVTTQLGISQDLAAALAERYAEGNPGDFDAALNGLTNAIEIAAEERAKGQLPGNVSVAVERIFRRADALNAAGEIDAASAELARLDAEYKHEVARLEQARLRIIDRRIVQAVIARDVGLAVMMELEKLALETSQASDSYVSHRRRFIELFVRGRDKGLRFDLEVAIELMREMSARFSKDPMQRGACLSNLGLALATLGERDKSTARLEDAIVAYNGALKERPRTTAALDWAATQNNLGNALQILGEREGGAARTVDAIAAYRSTLEVWTRRKAPQDWARTTSNLGVALKTLGERDHDKTLLEESVAAFRGALEVRERERWPQDWARTQSHLGSALSILGTRDRSTERLTEAIAVFRRALEERTRDRVPLDWARTQLNMSLAMLSLANHRTTQHPCPHLRRALAHAEAALEEYDLVATPYDFEVASRLRQALTAQIARDCGAPLVMGRQGR